VGDRDAEAAVALLRVRRPDVEWIPVTDPARMPPLEADAFFGNVQDGAVFERMAGLRWVQAWWAGIDGHQVPERVLFTRMVGAFTQDMAEHVLGQVLDWAKNFATARAQQAARVWKRYPTRRLSDLTVGVAGAGDIGRGIGRLLANLGARVTFLVRSPRPLEGAAAVYGPEDDRRFWAESDGVVLTLPLTAETAGMVDGRRIAWMRPAGFLINVGRGGVVDEAALLAGLDRGAPGWAYLDVTPTEPPPPDSRLWTHPRVVLTPHVSGAGHLPDLVDRSLDNLDRYLRGEPLWGVVDRRRGY